jgi:acyl-CoA synthetase (AMP-forming)/AMP-acid ligase II
MGSLAADGRLRITGRRRDRIVTGGENVTPAEVEAVLETDDAVAEACVVGVPSDEWGMEVAAALVARPDASPETDAVLARARARLAAFKLPKRVVWVSSLPRTASGKVKRGEVAVMLGAPPLPEEPPD